MLFAAFGALILIALLIQGLTVHKIGFGPLSVQFGQPGKAKEPPAASAGSTAAAASSGDTGATYKANPQDSDWPQSIASGGPATGTIELASPVADRAKSLTVSFTQVFGLRAPSGGITVRGVPIPR
ncbi:hypothetical protein [Crossiella sp. NPDC003009]